jgi:small-conductance mechanosensitive channel
MQIKQTNNLAIVSLVSGILGWTLLPWIGSLVAIVTGHMARAEIRRNQETQEGDGLAIAGLIMGWGMVALSILAVLAIFLFFGGIAIFLAWMGATGNLH